MVFSSPLFLFAFLPALLALYFLCRVELRNLLLMTASLGFYCWGEGRYVAVLLTSIALNYVFGLLLGSFRSPRVARPLIALAVTANLAMLVWFKYTNFLAVNLAWTLLRLGFPAETLLPWLGPYVDPANAIHLPLGISFFTFQALSYVIDVYRGEVAAQRGPIRFALYKTLFPQLIAGPVVRYRDVAAELAERSVTFDDFAGGLRRFVLGLAKKVLLANHLAVAADGIFAISPWELTAGLAWLGVVCYALQIFYDFSGYSDMAIGLGRMFGFRFPENFNHPYSAQSITDFWRRWHMSLSTWFRDYLYIPLGGNRRGPWRTYFNLLLVFVLCGFWHGPSWNFLVWGLMHGSFLVLERLGWGRQVERLPAPLRSAYVWLVVLAAWVFFREPTSLMAKVYLKAMFGYALGDGLAYSADLYLNAQLLLALAVGFVAAFPVGPWLSGVLARPRAARGPWPAMLSAGLALGRVTAEVTLLAASAACLAAGTHNPFIYFRF